MQNTKNKIARLCWNDLNWQKPSGKEGKSKFKNSFEYKYGYGHEEWIFDLDKMINGFHYGFLQQVKNIHRGNSYNISFYTIYGRTNEKWRIGEISNVMVIQKNESEMIYEKYKDNGWINEMKIQLKNVEIDNLEFEKMKPNELFNVKYKIKDFKILDIPLRISSKDKSIPSYYYLFQEKKSIPFLEDCVRNRFVFKPGHVKGKYKTNINYGQRQKDVDLVHNMMQENIYSQMVKKYGKNNVETEQSTGLGSRIDLVVKYNKYYIFYEIKAINSLRQAIRESMSQLLEYAYWPDRSRADKLVVISRSPINNNGKKYLKKLRKDFNINIYYQRYDPEKGILEDHEY